MKEPQDSTLTCTVSRDTLPSKCPERAVKILRSHGALVPIPENVRRGEVIWSGHAVCAFHEHRYEVRTVRSVSTLHEITPKDGTEPYLRPRYAAPVDAHIAHARYLDADAARAADWVYLPETDGEHLILTGGEYDAGVDGPAELITLVFNLEGYRGHYLTADFLSSAADLLEACQLDCARFHLDDPANFPLRDRVDAMVHEANEAWARYHAHNDVVGADPDQVADYGDDCPEDCPCQWISEVADDMESVLSDLGFLVDWNDGVYVFARS